MRNHSQAFSNPYSWTFVAEETVGQPSRMRLTVNAWRFAGYCCRLGLRCGGEKLLEGPCDFVSKVITTFSTDLLSSMIL